MDLECRLITQSLKLGGPGFLEFRPLGIRVQDVRGHSKGAISWADNGYIKVIYLGALLVSLVSCILRTGWKNIMCSRRLHVSK